MSYRAAIHEGRVVVEGLAGPAGIRQQLDDGVKRYVTDPRRRLHGRSLAEHREDLGALGSREPVHASHDMNFCAWRQVVILCLHNCANTVYCATWKIKTPFGPQVGPHDPTMEGRLTKLEDDCRAMRGDLSATRADTAYIRGRLESLPTTWQMIGTIMAGNAGLAGVLFAAVKLFGQH